MQQYEARPTEYKGVVFKSKSEAIFARGLDLIETSNGFGDTLRVMWHYEPVFLKTNDGYIPDFYLVVHDITRHFDDGRIKEYIIEYKPKLPNNTYISVLEKRAESLIVKNNKAIFILIHGSPFISAGDCYYDVGVQEYITKQEMIDCDCEFESDCGIFNESNFEGEYNFLFSEWSRAKKYRFDL